MKVLVTFNSKVENFKKGQTVVATKNVRTYSTTDSETFEVSTWESVTYAIEGMYFGEEYFSNVEDYNSDFENTPTEIDLVLNEATEDLEYVESEIIFKKDPLSLINEKSKLPSRKKLIATYLLLPNSKRGQAAKRVLIKRNKRLKIKEYAKKMGM